MHFSFPLHLIGFSYSKPSNLICLFVVFFVLLFHSVLIFILHLFVYATMNMIDNRKWFFFVCKNDGSRGFLLLLLRVTIVVQWKSLTVIMKLQTSHRLLFLILFQSIEQFVFYLHVFLSYVSLILFLFQRNQCEKCGGKH